MNKTNLQKWSIQLRKGFLELCVLEHLARQEAVYGLEILQRFKQQGLDVNEGTLYPLLNRMEQNGWLLSEWQTPAASGHPRRFYSLSDAGREGLVPMREEYASNTKILTSIRESK